MYQGVNTKQGISVSHRIRMTVFNPQVRIRICTVQIRKNPDRSAR